MISFAYLTLFVTREQLRDCRGWYTSHLDLKVVWESDQFILLQGDQGAKLGLHEGQPLAESDKVQLHFKVRNVDERVKKLKKGGVEVLRSPQDTSWGYRAAVLRDPADHTIELYQEM